MHEWTAMPPSIVGRVGLGFEIVALALIPLVLVRRKEPSSTIAWILALVFLPIAGALLFLAFGRDRVRLPARRKRELDAMVRADVAAHAPPSTGRLPETSALASPSEATDLELALFRVGAHLTHGRATTGNRTEALFGGDIAYAQIGDAIDRATGHVHAEYYLIRNDATGAWFEERLVAAAKRGVEVRLLCDGFGCFTLHASFTRAVREAGGRVATFLPMRSLLLQPVNLRNHRKIVVVDGTIGFTGGLNIGDEYRGTMPGLGEWRDVHMRVEGPAVRDLQRVFVQDWTFATGEALAAAKYFPPANTHAGAATIAMVPSGPDTRTEAIERVFFGAIAGARSHVWITTPYFVPDQAILVAMETAAMRGVDVKIVLPSRSNHGATFHAGRSFYEPLLEAGVQICEYTPGIVHAKTMVVDGAVCLVGSANMDLRSFRQNFEIHALVHDATLAKALEAQFELDVSKSQRVSLDQWRARGGHLRVLEGAARLVSPIL